MEETRKSMMSGNVCPQHTPVTRWLHVGKHYSISDYYLPSTTERQFTPYYHPPTKIHLYFAQNIQQCSYTQPFGTSLSFIYCLNTLPANLSKFQMHLS